MRVTDQVTKQRVGVDEAYERFFDGFFNLGRPGEIFDRTVVLSPPRWKPAKPPLRVKRMAPPRRRGQIKRTAGTRKRSG